MYEVRIRALGLELVGRELTRNALVEIEENIAKCKPADPITISHMALLGNAYAVSRHYAEAVQITREAISLKERVLDLYHQQTQTSGDLLFNIGFIEAKQEKKRMIANAQRCIKEDGEDHRSHKSSGNGKGANKVKSAGHESYKIRGFRWVVCIDYFFQRGKRHLWLVEPKQSQRTGSNRLRYHFLEDTFEHVM